MKQSLITFVRSGALPRQLTLECLDSVQKILFPLTDRKSKSLLLSLTSTSSFDPDCLRFDSASIRNHDEKDIAYHYFGEHLAELYDELENPTPRGSLEKWLERRSGARYVMLATLIGVILRCGFGDGGIGRGSVSSLGWISTMAAPRIKWVKRIQGLHPWTSCWTISEYFLAIEQCLSFATRSISECLFLGLKQTMINVEGRGLHAIQYWATPRQLLSSSVALNL